MTEVDLHYREHTEDIEAYLASVHDAPRLALDLEADGLFSYREKICLIQVSDESTNHVLDPLAGREALTGLGSLLADPGVEKIFHGADFDIRLLKRDLGFPVRGLFDTMVAAQLVGRTQVGLAALLQQHFDVVLNKKFQKANWADRPLRQEMLHYAALDTAYLLPLRDLLVDELEQLGRRHWAEEECRLLEAAEPTAPKPPSCFDVKGAGRLPPKSLAVLQALLEVRDQYARQWDRPPFKVLSNAILLQWAERPPRNRAQLMRSSGASKPVLNRLSDALCTAVEGAAREPLDRFVRPPAAFSPLTSAQEKRLKRLKKIRLQRSEQLALPVGLLVNTGTLEHLVRQTPNSVEDALPRALKNWQMEAIGDKLRSELVV